MNKFQTIIVLNSIEYKGKSIGRNFAVNVSINRNFYSLKRTLIPHIINKCNETVFNKDIALPINLDIKLKVTENDGKPDEGKYFTKLSVTDAKDKKYSFKISMGEKGSLNNVGAKCELIFNFEFKYIELCEKTLVEVDKKGWINGKIVNKDGTEGKQVTLPYGLRFKHYKTEFFNRKAPKHSGKEYFTVLEGIHKGKNVRLLLPRELKSRLKKNFKYKPPCSIVFTIKKRIEKNKYSGKVKVEGIGGEINAITNVEDCLQDGVYDLEIPDMPHEHGKNYEKVSVYSLSWFRIKLPNQPRLEYYFNLGLVSNGCITVLAANNPPAIWTRIYNRIVICRQSNKEGIIGQVRVINEVKN